MEQAQAEALSYVNDDAATSSGDEDLSDNENESERTENKRKHRSSTRKSSRKSTHHAPSSPHANRNTPTSQSPSVPSNFNPRGMQTNSPRMSPQQPMHRTPSGNTMPISQMNAQMNNMNLSQQRNGNFGAQQAPQSNFQGLQWQGMGSNGQQQNNNSQQNGQTQRRNW